MKTIYHLAISRLKYNKGRSILTIVAVALMTTPVSYTHLTLPTIRLV